MSQSKLCLTCGCCCLTNICLGNVEDLNNPNRDYIIQNEKVLTKVSGQYWLSFNKHSPRCNNLEGIVGKEVRCSFYKNRPNLCRDYPKDRKDIEFCNILRAKIGLRKITWEEFLRGS